jgi:hypothetical protein
MLGINIRHGTWNQAYVPNAPNQQHMGLNASTTGDYTRQEELNITIRLLNFAD